MLVSPCTSQQRSKRFLIWSFLVTWACCTQQAEGNAGPAEQLCRWHWRAVRLIPAGAVSVETPTWPGQQSCQLGGDWRGDVLGIFCGWKTPSFLCYPNNSHLRLQSLHVAWKSTFFYWFCSPKLCLTKVNYRPHPFFQAADQQSRVIHGKLRWTQELCGTLRQEGIKRKQNRNGQTESSQGSLVIGLLTLTLGGSKW